MHSLIPWRKHMQSFKLIDTKLYEELRSQEVQCTHCLYTEGEKWLSSQCGKVTEKFQQLYQNHMHILIPWRKQAKFQNIRFKTIPPSLIRVFAVRSVGSAGPKLSTCGQRIRWSDWDDAQADLSLRWATMQFCWSCHEMAHLLCMWPGGSSLRVYIFFLFFFLFFFFQYFVRFSSWKHAHIILIP